ncbi:MAG: alpha/beta fold hydrolase, partial [Actinomycetes bacterium]
MRRIAILGIVLAAIAIAAVSGWFAVSAAIAAMEGPSPAAGLTPGSTSTPIAPAPPPRVRAVQVKKLRPISGTFKAAGLQQYIECHGPTERKAVPGEPPLVVIPGLHSGINYLSGLTENLLRTHYVCVYDRPGNELSPYRSGRLTLTAQDHARELAALLTRVGITGPVVLVPHSYPGLIAQAFWQAFPERVAGIVLLDTPPPGMGIGSMWSESNTSVDITVSQKLIAKGPRMGNVPLMIVSSGAGGVDTPETPARALDKFSTNVEHILLRERRGVVAHDP